LLKEYLYNTSFFVHLIVWVLAGVVSPLAVIPVIFISNSIWFRDDAYLEVVLGLFFMTLLSDSRNPALLFAQTVKPVQLIIIFLLFSLKISQNGIKSKIHVSLGLYLLIGIICLTKSPILFQSFQKTLSYFLIILIVPNLLIWDWEINKDKTIRHLLLFLSIILTIGLLARISPIPLIEPFLAGRFTGLFGNPNGVGVFAFMVIMLLNLCKYFYPQLFSNRETIFIYGLAFISIVTSGSRGALLASIIFIFFRYFGYRFGLAAFLGLVGFILSFEYALELFADTALSLGLGEFLRIDTIESGSGRLIAIDFAWIYIQDNYWIGPGIGYGDYLFKLNYYYLASLGHQGQVHNAYINTWLDVGLIGLIAFVLGWGKIFFEAIKNLKYAWGILAAVFVSTNAEVWIVGSLSPWMITFLCLITLVVYLKPEEASNEEVKLVNPLILKEDTIELGKEKLVIT